MKEELGEKQRKVREKGKGIERMEGKVEDKENVDKGRIG